MKTMNEFRTWLDSEGRYKTIQVSEADFSWLWNRVDPSSRLHLTEQDVIRIEGRVIQGPPVPKLWDDLLDVSDRTLFE